MDRSDHRTLRGARLRLFFLFHFFLGLGAVAGFFSANSLLIGRFGPSLLFHAYLCQGVLTVLLSAIFYFLADRLRKDVFPSVWFSLLGVLVLGSWALLQWGPDRAGLVLGVRSLFDAVVIASSLGFWLMVGDRFSPQGAKKHYSGLMAAYILGDMAGGLLLERTAAVVHGSNFIMLWGMLLAAAPLVFRGIFRGGPATGLPAPVEPAEAAPQLSRGKTGVFNPLALVLFAFWMIYSFFSDATDYLFNAAASSRWPGEDALAAYFGKVALFANAGILGYHLLLSKHVLQRFGVDLTAALIPVLIAAAWALAYAHPSLATLSLAQGLVYFFLDYFAIAHLHIPLTVFSRSSRGRVKAFTEGFGRACGFILLFGVAGFFSFRPEFAELGRIVFLGALAFLAFPAVFRSVYLNHLLKALRAKDRRVVLNAVAGLGERGKARAVPFLVVLYRRSRSRRLKRAIVRCFGRMRSPAGMQAVLSDLDGCDRPLRATILQVCREWEGSASLSVGHWRVYGNI